MSGGTPRPWLFNSSRLSLLCLRPAVLAASRPTKALPIDVVQVLAQLLGSQKVVFGGQTLIFVLTPQ